MVSKRNRNRKTAEKVIQPAEKPAEINVEQILTAVTQKVVEVLKPDLEQKVTAVQTTLSNQIKAEMQRHGILAFSSNYALTVGKYFRHHML